MVSSNYDTGNGINENSNDTTTSFTDITTVYDFNRNLLGKGKYGSVRECTLK
jgi:hypothetical protein